MSIALILACLETCMLQAPVTGENAPGALDFDYLPQFAPSKEFVETLLRSTKLGPVTPQTVERITIRLGARTRHPFPSVARLLTSSAFPQRAEIIYREATGKAPTIAQVVDFAVDYAPMNDSAFEVERLRRSLDGPTMTISGKVVDKTGAPVSDALVVDASRRSFVRTDAGGGFSLSAPMPAEKQSLEIFAFQEGFGCASFQHSATPQPILDQRLVLSDEFVARGRLVDSQGRPVELAGVAATAPVQTVVARLNAYTNSLGNFELAGLPGGIKFLRIETFDRRHSHGYLNVSTPATGTPIELKVESGSELSGRVVDEAGKPVPCAWVQLRYEDTNAQNFDDCFTDDMGKFAFFNVKTDRWDVVAEAPGLALAYLSLDIDQRTPLRDIVLKAPPGQWIAGTATLPDGKPAARATIRFTNVGKEDLPKTPTLQTITDANGAFRIGPAPDGLLLSVQAALTVESVTHFGAATSKAGDSDLTISLTPAAGRP